jgi:hypothetical protein
VKTGSAGSVDDMLDQQLNRQRDSESRNVGLFREIYHSRDTPQAHDFHEQNTIIDCDAIRLLVGRYAQIDTWLDTRYFATRNIHSQEH